MRNFYNETVKALYESGRTIEDVKYIIGMDFEGSYANADWDLFSKMAKQIEYNPIFKSEPVISPAIHIGGDKWYMYRTVVKGKECWQMCGLLNDSDEAEFDDPSELLNNYDFHNEKNNESYRFINLEEEE